MIAYRLCRKPHTSLDGEGSRLYGGRWNPKGVAVVYASSTMSLCALECLVHFSQATIPVNYVSIGIEIPDDLPIEEWSRASLPRDWADTPAPVALQKRGADWVREGRSAVVIVPSAVIPTENNVLINPRHPSAERIRARKPEPFSFDARLRK